MHQKWVLKPWNFTHTPHV